MKFANFTHDGRVYCGIVSGGELVALTGDDGRAASLEELLPLGHQDQQALAVEMSSSSSVRVKESEASFLPCILHPGKIVCVGLNYRTHARETGMPIPETPVLFSKFSDTVAAHRQAIPVPTGATQIDYEGELGIMIGRETLGAGLDDALDGVFGYFVANDVSARDLQLRTSQWLLGKTCEAFCPVGPYVVTADEVKNPDALDLETRVNGEVRQRSSTSDMIFGCRQLVSYISQYIRLRPGDIILTGTPSGVILGRPEAERSWLRRGDVVSITISGLGTLTNTFA